jgi:hypothetical protein
MNPAAPTSVSTPTPRAAARGRRVPWLPVLAATLSFALGWAASGAWSATTGLRITERLSGTVSLVNTTGEAICLAPDGDGPQRCGVAFEPRDERPLAVGDHVAAAVGWLRTSRGTDEEVFVIVTRE